MTNRNDEALRAAARGLVDALDSGTDARDWLMRVKSALTPRPEPAEVLEILDRRVDDKAAPWRDPRDFANDANPTRCAQVWNDAVKATSAALSRPEPAGRDAVIVIRDLMAAVEARCGDWENAHWDEAYQRAQKYLAAHAPQEGAE